MLLCVVISVVLTLQTDVENQAVFKKNYSRPHKLVLYQDPKAAQSVSLTKETVNKGVGSYLRREVFDGKELSHLANNV